MKEALSRLEKAIEILEGLFRKERSQGNYKEALDRATRIVELSKELYDLDPNNETKQLLERSEEQLTEIKKVLEQLKEAAETEQISEETIKHVQELLEICQSFSRSGDIALVSDDYDEALFFYENALESSYLAVKIWENYETLRELETLHSKIAYIHEYYEDFKKAQMLYEANLEIDKKLLEAFRSQENYDRIAYTLSHLGDLIRTEEPDKALKYYKKNIKYREEATKILGTAETYHDLQNDIIKAARLYQKAGRENDALYFYEQALPVIEMIQEKGFADGRTPLLKEAILEQIKKLST